MVRINLIDAKNLTDQHLLAEYNEILMLCGYIRKYGNAEDKPKTFTLGKGHIKFFSDKLLYLLKRFEHIKQELICRDYNVTKPFPFIVKDDLRHSGTGSGLILEPNLELWNDYEPTLSAYLEILRRLRQKYEMKPDFYTYYGKKCADSIYRIGYMREQRNRGNILTASLFVSL